jgi:hypothetical protein
MGTVTYPPTCSLSYARGSTANNNIVQLDDFIEAFVRVTVHMNRQRVRTFPQHEPKPECERLWHGHVLGCEPASRNPEPIVDADPPPHRLPPWITVCVLYLAPLRTRHGLAKIDLQYDLLAGAQSISLEKQSGDGECRIRAQEGLDVLSATESALTKSHAVILVYVPLLSVHLQEIVASTHAHVLDVTHGLEGIDSETFDNLKCGLLSPRS